MLEQKGILIHEISFKSLSTPQQPTSNPPLFPPPKKKKNQANLIDRPSNLPKSFSPSLKTRVSLSCCQEGNRYQKKERKKIKKKKKEKKKNDDEERDACLANN